MAAARVTSPFGADPVEEVPLLRAPLARVLSQVRWPQVTRLQSDLEAVAKQFGLALADEYPLITRQQEMQVVLTPEGVSQHPAGLIFLFGSADEAWRVSLSETFVTLETSSYTSKDDFCDRLEVVLDALSSVIEIPFVTRIGFRYVNRVDDPLDLAQLTDLVDGAVLGGAAVPLGDDAQMVHTLSEAVYDVGEAKLLARWAQLPAGSTIDPAIPPLNRRSWVLDLDASRETRFEFQPRVLGQEARRLSSVGYRFFRWATTDLFLKRFGGEQ